MSPTKIVAIMRTDLNMRKGKMVAQAGHAYMAWLTLRLEASGGFARPTVGLNEVYLHTHEIDWLNNSFVKICVGIGSEEELLALHEATKDEVESHLIQDSGLTEFGGVPTYTCLALGPDYSEKIDPFTGHLKLL